MFWFPLIPQKASQAAAVILNLNNKKLNYLKFIKQVYLTDREALGRWDRPIFGGRYVSMPHGPVLSEVYDWISGNTDEKNWSSFIKTEGYDIYLQDDPGIKELCQAEIDVLTEIDLKFKNYDQWQLRDYCHQYCKEYEDLLGSSITIQNEILLKTLGKDEIQIKKISENMEDMAHFKYIFGV
jgi:uncharacterized phage-associated protein